VSIEVRLPYSVVIIDSGGRAGLRTRVELYETLCCDARREELLIRALAERRGGARRTVRAALASAGRLRGLGYVSDPSATSDSGSARRSRRSRTATWWDTGVARRS